VVDFDDGPSSYIAYGINDGVDCGRLFGRFAKVHPGVEKQKSGVRPCPR
jgi:hypothetical protein